MLQTEKDRGSEELLFYIGYAFKIPESDSINIYFLIDVSRSC